ncbi:hypothetical protein AALC17_19250 [Oscillospiraceae bacterium 38-13]
MTGWTFFFTIVGVAFLTALLFRLIDLIERPARHPYPGTCRKTLPRAWRALQSAFLQEWSWMSWKS